jgi:hypothetical protein
VANRLFEMKERLAQRPGWASFCVFAFYLAFSLLTTLPLALHFTTQVPGHGSDSYQYLWNLWLVQHSVSEGHSPLQTNLAFWPDGVQLYIGMTAPLEALVVAPVLFLAGAIPAFNVLAIVKPALDAFAAFVLALHLWGDRLAALWAGLAFGFCTYVAARGTIHPSLVDVAFIAFAVLWLLKAVETGARRYFLFFAAAVFVNVVMLHYALYVAMFAGLFLVWQTLRLWRAREMVLTLWRRAAWAGAAALVASAPLVAMVVGQSPRAAGSPKLARAYGADLLAYFAPSPHHPGYGFLFGSLYRRIVQFDNLPEALVFPGYAVLVLAALAHVLYRPPAPPSPRWLDVGPRFWTFVALVFVILSLGLELRVAGHFTGVPLPYAIFNRLPFWSSQNAPSRWSIVAQLALSMLGAASIAGLRARAEGRLRAIALPLAFLILVAESWWAPYEVGDATSPSPFYASMAGDGGTYSVVDVPYGAVRDRSVLAQMTHGKPTVGGYALRPANYLPDQMLPPFYDLNLYWPFFEEDVVPFDLKTETAPVLRAFGVRYLLLHRDLLTEPYLKWARALLEKAMLGRAVYADSRLEVYRVPGRESGPVVVATRFFVPDGKPSRLEPPALSRHGLKYRETRGEATLGIWASVDTKSELDVTAWRTEEGAPLLSIELNEGPLGSLALGGEPGEFKSRVELHEGANWLVLRGRAAISRIHVTPIVGPASGPGSAIR